MNLPDFDYHAPRTVPEACALLDDLGPEAVVMAGGTDLLHKMKGGKLKPRAVVSLRNVEALKGVSELPGGGLSIASATTQNELMGSGLLLRRYYSVADAAHQMASHQIRNRGTIGGNIVNAVPSADLPPILVALGARITLESSRGIREMALEEFFVEPASSVIEPGEILTRVVIPESGATGSRYVKFGLRRSGALAVAGAAVALKVYGGRIAKARIALASCAPVVMRSVEAENFLAGRTPDGETLEELARIVSGEARPRDSIRGSAEYRRHLAGVLAKRAAKSAFTHGHGSPEMSEEDS